MEFDRTVGLEVYALGVILAKHDKGCVFGFGVASEGQRQFLGVVNVELGLVGTGAHDPVAIFADADAVARLLEVEVLEELEVVEFFGFVLGRPLSAAGEPFWKGSGSRRPRYGVSVVIVSILQEILLSRTRRRTLAPRRGLSTSWWLVSVVVMDGARMEDAGERESFIQSASRREVLESNPNPYLNFLRQKICESFEKRQHGQKRKADSHRR